MEANKWELPEGWVWSTLGNSGDIVTGSTPPKKNPEFYGEAIPFFRPAELNQGYFTREASVYLSEDGRKRARILPAGSVLVTCIGATIGKTGYSRVAGATNQQINAIVPNGSVLGEFLYYLMISPQVQEMIIGNASSTTLPILNKSKFSRLPIPLPPLAEQRRIVARLDALLGEVRAARERLSALPGLVQALRQAVLSRAVSGELTKEWRGEEKDWPQLRASELCEVVQSGSTPKGSPFTETGDVPYLKVYNIVDQKVAFDYKPQFISREIHEGKLKRSIALPGDVLMNIVGPPLGKIAIVPIDYPEWNLNQAITLFRPKQCMLSKYLYYYFCEGTVIREIMPETKGSAGQKNISLTQCRNFNIPLPPLAEQQEIVRRVEAAFAAIDALEESYAAAWAQVEALPGVILGKAFRGELSEQPVGEKPPVGASGL